MEIFDVNAEECCGLGDRIKAVRKAQKMTQKEFAASLGIVQGFLCSLEKGKKSPSNTFLIALRTLYGISSDWLRTGHGEITASNYDAAATIGGISPIPFLSTPPTSLDLINAASPVDYVLFPDAPPDSFAFRYSGDFMTPTVRDGDIVIINPRLLPVSGDIILIVGQWGDPFLRRYRVKGGEVFCSADNSLYSTFKLHDGATILGTVQHIWRRIRF